MHNESEETTKTERIDEYKMTVGEMTIEVYNAPPFLLTPILNEFLVVATIQKARDEKESFDIPELFDPPPSIPYPTQPQPVPSPVTTTTATQPIFTLGAKDLPYLTTTTKKKIIGDLKIPEEMIEKKSTFEKLQKSLGWGKQ